MCSRHLGKSMRSMVGASARGGSGVFRCCWGRESGEDCCGLRGGGGCCILLAASIDIGVFGSCFNASSSIGRCWHIVKVSGFITPSEDRVEVTRML